MLAQSFLNGTLPLAEYWVIPIISLGSAGVGFMLGHAMGRRRREEPEPAPLPRTGEEFDPFVAGSQHERRGMIRRQGNSIEVQLADTESGRDLGSGWIVDRSLGGLCIATDHAFDKGALVNTRPRQGGTPWVALEVRSCRQENGRWELGCRFVRTPSYNILLLFG